ncbi:hypothetical protein NADFUDRAFT_53732 [Nadsonia fulvescens var. elongata DSM 6958]|uniref:Sorting nexin MVP1 n=1 Tax=Nadsonia fulvescens var. elongata DSM 6958 TaxID=857566 RepID=A0A1E3PD00_9ASCO|nr:hypothetical protein NADFUDRAFT_53732 [Nadsonia fulvescens var. elongata DSM 6958]
MTSSASLSGSIVPYDPWAADSIINGPGSAPNNNDTHVEPSNGVSDHNENENGENIYDDEEDIDDGWQGAALKEKILKFNPNQPDTLVLRVMPEREGMFGFRHVNYIIESASKVVNFDSPSDDKDLIVRRYSDFAWLDEILSSKYTFRLMPPLPPKRLTLDGRHLASDDSFGERRQRGLTRYLNQLLLHPGLNSDPIIHGFVTLTSIPEFNQWKKRMSMETVGKDELIDRVISKSFVRQYKRAHQGLTLQTVAVPSAPATTASARVGDETWVKLRPQLAECCDSFSNLSILVNRIVKRYEEQAQDFRKLAHIMTSTIDPLTGLYSLAPENVPQIMHGVEYTGSIFTQHAQSLTNSAQKIQSRGLLENIKRLLSQLVGVKDLFDRVEKEINQLDFQLNNYHDRISLTVKKLVHIKKSLPNSQAQARAPAAASFVNTGNEMSAEFRKLAETHQLDKIQYTRLINRKWLIREIVQEELLLFQKTQFMIVKLLQSLAEDKSKENMFAGSLWSDLESTVMEIPLNYD